MKLITTIIKPFKLVDVREALPDRCISSGCNRSKRLGRQKGYTELYRGAAYWLTSFPK